MCASPVWARPLQPDVGLNTDARPSLATGTRRAVVDRWLVDRGRTYRAQPLWREALAEKLPRRPFILPHFPKLIGVCRG